MLASVVALFKDQRALAWALIVVFAVSLASSFYSAIAAKLRAAINGRRNDELARKAVPDFRKLLRRFEYFVGYPTQNNDMLYEIARNELCLGNTASLDQLHLLPADMFRDLCYGLEHRMARRAKTLEEFLGLVSDMNFMVRYFCRYCAEPIFGRFPQELRNLLTERSRSSLEAFRERFVDFIDDYSEFLKTFDESFSMPVVVGGYFPRPKPL